MTFIKYFASIVLFEKSKLPVNRPQNTSNDLVYSVNRYMMTLCVAAAAGSRPDAHCACAINSNVLEIMSETTKL